jgi:hypothetical protein
MVILNQNSVRLCRAGSCCPIVEKVNENEFTISDDYKGKVRLTKDEVQMLKDALEHLDKSV